MKKVLVISYYWPPAGGGGVQRWLKFAKYLPDFGWKPIVFAPEGADYPLLDPSLVEEIPEGLDVIKRPILEPRRLYGPLAGSRDRRSEEADEIFHRDPTERTWLQNVAVWMRGNLLIPDARVLWVRPSVRFLTNYLVDHPVDAIVTTGPPHSIHLIGRRLHRRTAIPWVADFRDPWTEIEFFGAMSLTGRSKARHRSLESAVLRDADAVTTVSPTWAKRFEGRCDRVSVITNGFDEADFRDREPVDRTHFRITHVGSLSMDRDPLSLWKALKDLVADEPMIGDRLEVALLGRVDPGIAESAQRHGLGSYVSTPGYLSHRESIDAMCRSSVLLLLINRDTANAPGRIPGKLFEYLAAGRPILVIGPVDGDAATIVSETGAGAVVDFDDVEGIKRCLTDWHRLSLDGALQTDEAATSRFNRRNLAGQFADLLRLITEG